MRTLKIPNSATEQTIGTKLMSTVLTAVLTAVLTGKGSAARADVVAFARVRRPKFPTEEP